MADPVFKGSTPEDRDHWRLNRGKYRGKTPSEVAEIDPGYVVWIAENWDDHPVSDALVRDCKRDLENAARGRHEE